MIELGLIPNARAAQAFVDYAKGLGIHCQLEAVPQGVVVVLLNSEKEAQARDEFDQFLSHPNDDKYLQASWDNGSTQTKFDYGSGTLGLVQQFITGALANANHLFCLRDYLRPNELRLCQSAI